MFDASIESVDSVESWSSDSVTLVCLTTDQCAMLSCGQETLDLGALYLVDKRHRSIKLTSFTIARHQ